MKGSISNILQNGNLRNDVKEQGKHDTVSVDPNSMPVIVQNLTVTCNIKGCIILSDSRALVC